MQVTALPPSTPSKTTTTTTHTQKNISHNCSNKGKKTPNKPKTENPTNSHTVKTKILLGEKKTNKWMTVQQSVGFKTDSTK